MQLVASRRQSLVILAKDCLLNYIRTLEIRAKI